MPAFIPPMLCCRLQDPSLLEDPHYVTEPKFVDAKAERRHAQELEGDCDPPAEAPPACIVEPVPFVCDWCDGTAGIAADDTGG